MSARVDPAPYLWWLVSRASGIVALGLVSITVLLGLVMATRILRRPGAARALVRLHEHLALVSLAAIALHGASLLGDRWLRPGLQGLTVPFAMSYRPLFTGLGIIGGYLAAVLGLSFYARRRIGVRLWRRLHRATVLVWVLGVAHTLGAGSDAATAWLRACILLTGVPILYLAMLRLLQSRGAQRRGASRQARAAPASSAAARSDAPAHSGAGAHRRVTRSRPAEEAA